MSERCYLVYAVAPAGTNARHANDQFNDYIADDRRGICVFHDHFVGEHGGVAVFDVRSDDELAAVHEPGPLVGWDIRVHGLTFALTAVGFAAQMEFTLDRYRGTNLEALRATEAPDKRYWWRAASE
jgi:rhodanese-related sulfurtransferase